jgi:acyl-coenzyme A thioesterase PaaI-like protein
MSKAVRSHNIVGMTRHMEVDYKRPVPSCASIRLEGRVYHHEGRKHWAEADILDDAGTVLAHSKGLFIEVRPRHEHVALSGEPTPHG